MLAIMSAILALQTVPTKIEDRMVNNWLVSVMGDDHSCSAITAYRGSYQLMLTYDFGKNVVDLTVSAERFRSIKAGDERSLEISFLRNDKLDQGWGEKTFFAINATVGMGLTTRLNAQILDDFAKSDIFGLGRDGVVVGSFNLKNTAPVIAALRQCARDRNRESPSDPLED